MPIALSPLPYEKDALEPHISARTLSYHYGKHHQGYVDKLNAAIEDTEYASKSLDQIVLDAHASGNTSVFNNAAQVWNHSFLWNSMAPRGGGKPDGVFAKLIEQSFGSLDSFHEQFKKAATGQFGSGWAWLIRDGQALKVVATANAANPLVNGKQPLLTLDVWEHAYYLDYQNDRGSYVDVFLDKLVNWEFAADNLTATREAA